MLSKRLGRQTVRLGEPVSVVSFANIGGKQEAQGPLAGYFDELNQDPYFGQKSWEKGESAMQQFALQKAMEKGGLGAEDLDYVLAGDLLNQCIGTSFGLRDFKIPFYGLYGACSTMGALPASPPQLPALTSARRSGSTGCRYSTVISVLPPPNGQQQLPGAVFLAGRGMGRISLM